MEGLAFVFHIWVFVVNGYSLVWDIVYLKDPNGEPLLYYRGFPGKFKYLTFWCQLLQTIYFAVATLNDMFGNNSRPEDDPKKRCGLQKFRDVLFAGVAFPMGTFVVATFWSIYAYDRELVYPEVLDKIIPSWLNHVMHTTVIVFLLIEAFLIYHPYPSRRLGLSLCIIFSAIYQAWILWIAYYANIWVYPILAILPWYGQCVFFAFCWLLVIICYSLGEAFTAFFWRVPLKTKVEKIN